MATTTLFTLPILTAADPEHGSGSIVCTTAADSNIYVLTFTAAPDNRLVTGFCQSLLLALDIIEFSYPNGVVVTTSGIPKFYSNGLDLQHAETTKGFWTDSLYKVFARLVTYPMPTVALMNGHAFAGGLMLAMYHDYRIFNSSRGFLCLNELDFGYPLKPAMSSIFKVKVRDAAVYRSLVLEAKRFTAADALSGGIVDALGGMDETLSLIRERKLTEKGKSGIYGIMKHEMYKEPIELLASHETQEKRDQHIVQVENERKRTGEYRVREWRESNKKKTAKL